MLAGPYLVNSIQVHNQMKKEIQRKNQSDMSIKDYDWKKFKNNPWQ